MASSPLSIRGRSTTILVAGLICGWGSLGGERPADGVGALCNGRPASSVLLDASYQPGPAILDGTPGDDVIIGSVGGHDRIDGHGGSDVVCGGPGGYGSITVGPESPDRHTGGDGEAL